MGLWGEKPNKWSWIWMTSRHGACWGSTVQHGLLMNRLAASVHDTPVTRRWCFLKHTINAHLHLHITMIENVEKNVQYKSSQVQRKQISTNPSYFQIESFYRFSGVNQYPFTRLSKSDIILWRPMIRIWIWESISAENLKNTAVEMYRLQVFYFLKKESAQLLQQILSDGQWCAFRSIIYQKAAHWERKAFSQTLIDFFIFSFINHLWSA